MQETNGPPPSEKETMACPFKALYVIKPEEYLRVRPDLLHN